MYGVPYCKEHSADWGKRHRTAILTGHLLRSVGKQEADMRVADDFPDFPANLFA